MIKFKIGDKVRTFKDPSYGGVEGTGIVEDVLEDGKKIIVRQDGSRIIFYYLTLNGFIKHINSMSKTTRIQKKLLDKDTQILIEAGYLSDNLEMTDAGEDELENIIFEEHMDKLVASAKEKLSEEKKESKKKE